MFDETTDISHNKQISLSFRYFKDGVVKEDFLCVCDAYGMLQCAEGESSDGTKELRLTGIGLAKIVENLCHKFDKVVSLCVGIGTDSCSVMASDVKDAVQGRRDCHLQCQSDNPVIICNALERISTWQENKMSNDAHCLLQTPRSSDLIISSICLNDILGK